jgi:hypothetical protein
MVALARCPLLNSPVTTLKVLSTVHELMQKGSPAVLPASCRWLDHFELVESHWGPDQMGAEFGLAQVCGPLIVAYAAMLAAKAMFHASFGAFENNYSFDARYATEADDHDTGPVSAAALGAMLTLGRRCRVALDVAAGILPRDPPLAALQWHRLVAHVGKLVAVEAHLLHGAAVYVAATLAEQGAAAAAAADGVAGAVGVEAGGGRVGVGAVGRIGGIGGIGGGGMLAGGVAFGRGRGLPGEEARGLAAEHAALRQTFVEARARPAMMSAFVEEGGDPALPPGWLGEGGAGGAGGGGAPGGGLRVPRAARVAAQL